MEIHGQLRKTFANKSPNLLENVFLALHSTSIIPPSHHYIEMSSIETIDSSTQFHCANVRPCVLRIHLLHTSLMGWRINKNPALNFKRQLVVKLPDILYPARRLPTQIEEVIK